MDKCMFDELFGVLIFWGIVIGIALVGAGWALWHFVLSHLHWM